MGPGFRLLKLGLFVLCSTSAFAQNWFQTQAPVSTWTGIACSFDGTTVIATSNGGDIYVSHNSGKSWALTDSPKDDWIDVNCSWNGQHIVTIGLNGNICISTNGGLTWNIPTPYAGWVSVSMSADGNRIACLSYWGPFLYASADAGNTWNWINIPTDTDTGHFGWSRSITGSIDGQKLFVTTLEGSTFLSEDFGTNWEALPAPATNCCSIASSWDGNKLIACSADTPGVYLSTDDGQSWTSTRLPSNIWYSVSSSAKGMVLVAAAGGWSGFLCPVYISRNAGKTWSPAPIPEHSWYATAVSADSSHIFTAAFNGPIYTASFGPLRQRTSEFFRPDR